MSPVLAVVAGVIVDQGLILACRRATHVSAAGLWEFPGGKIEPGEDARQALVREIGEELSVTVEVGGELTSDETRVGERTIRLTCFVARLSGARPTASTDHDQLRWVTRGDLMTLEWAAPDRPAVRLLSQGSGVTHLLP